MAIDLTGQFFNIAQGTIKQGQPIDLNFSVLNSGDDKVDPFSFDIVISKDRVISDDDYKLGNYEIRDSLEAGEDSGLKSFRYSTPAADSSFWQGDTSTYTVGILLDPEREYFESNEDNNSNVGLGVDFDTVSTAEFGPSDLKGKYLSFRDETYNPGEKVGLTFAIDNIDTGLANPFSVDIYLSSSEGVAEDSVKLGTYDIRANVPGGRNSGEKRFNYTLPELGEPIWENGDGEYYIAFDIDSGNEVDETNEDNNSGQMAGVDFAPIEITGLSDAADLVVTSFSAPENAQAGDTVTVNYEIANQGGSAADFFAAGFYLFGEDYLNDNDSFDRDDRPEIFLLQGDAASADINLEPGATTGMMTTELTLPDTWAGYSGNGDYYLGVEADTFEDIDEVSDVNNSLTGEMVDYQKVSLEAPVNNTVDLVGTNFEVVQDQIIPGQEFDLAFTVANEGMAAVDEFNFELYLSQDPDISAEDDIYLGRYDIRDGLDGMDDTNLDGDIPISIRYTAPDADNEFWSEGDGAYYAGMVIDPANDVVETNEDNNSNLGAGLDSVQAFVTGLGTVADLKTNGSFDVEPDTIATGETFDVSYDIFNDGTESAEFFAAGFFIFTEDYLTDKLMNDEPFSLDDPSVYILQGDGASSDLNLEPATGTGVVTTTLTMPSDWEGFAMGSGEYYVGVAADPFGDIIESDETNNSLMGEFIDYEKVTINVAADI